MKKIVATVLLLTTIVCMAQADGIVRWVETFHDFGTFSEELNRVSCQIRFVNDGDSAVVITDVRPTCGCTATDYPKRAIEPGDTAAISLTYNPIGRPGRFRKDVYVYTSVKPSKSIVYIKGNVIGSAATMQSKYPVGVGAMHIDSRLVPFGELMKGRTRTAFINGYNLGKDTLNITFLDVPKHLRVAAVPAVVAPGEMAAVTVTYYTGKTTQWGLTQDDFKMVMKPCSATADSVDGQVEVEVMAIVKEDFDKLTADELAAAPKMTCSTDKIDFGAIDTDKVSRQFTICNDGKTRLLIRKIYSLDDFINVKCNEKELKPGKTATITVTVNPPLVTTPYVNSKLSIITNDPKQSQVPVRIIGLKK